MKAIINSLSVLLTIMATAVAPLSLTSCSDDSNDDGPEPKMEISLAGQSSFISFVSEGFFELPVRLTGEEGLPKAEDFTLTSYSQSHLNLVYDWDELSTDPASGGEIKKLTVSEVRKGEEDGIYILTVNYDASGNMCVYNRKTTINYKNTVSADTFDFSYEGMAQRSVAMPLQIIKKSEASFKTEIDVLDAYKELNIDHNAIHTDSNRRRLYVGTENDTELDAESYHTHWKDHPTVFPGIGALFGSDGTTPILTIRKAGDLDTGKTYFMHLVMSLGNGDYAAIHVPIRIEE